MKKAMPILLLCCFLLAACSSGKTPQDEFRMEIHQATGGPIYGIRAEFILDGTPIGEQGTVALENRTVVPIQPGDTVTLSLKKQQLPEDASLHTLSVELYIISQDGTQTKTSNDIHLSPDCGKQYDFRLTGNPSNYLIKEMAPKE